MKARLSLFDPDAGYAFKLPATAWPTLAGSLITDIDGLYGKRWYLMELDQPLPLGFDPLEKLPEYFRSRPLRFLLLSPSPNMNTDDIPENFIGEEVSKGDPVPVGVMVADGPDIPSLLSIADVLNSYPSLCSGKLIRA